MIELIDSKIIPINRMISGLCKLPYHRHSKGCINHGKKDGCPPGLLSLEEVFDFNENIYVVYTNFSIGRFAEKMRLLHPEWKEEIYLDDPKYNAKIESIKNKLAKRNPSWDIEYFPIKESLARKSSREWYNPRR